MIFLPFCLTADQQDSIKVSAGMISAFASLITLSIALILFDKYGLKKDLIKSQGDLVLNQREKIKSVNFLISSEDGVLNFFPGKDRINDYERFYSNKLVFSDKYWNYINDVFQISSSIRMPPNIAEKINTLKPSIVAYLKPDQINSYSKVTFWGEKDDGVKYSKMNDSEITFQEFYQIWIEILDEIDSWLNDKKIYTNKLNTEY